MLPTPLWTFTSKLKIGDIKQDLFDRNLSFNRNKFVSRTDLSLQGPMACLNRFVSTIWGHTETKTKKAYKILAVIAKPLFCKMPKAIFKSNCLVNCMQHYKMKGTSLSKALYTFPPLTRWCWGWCYLPLPPAVQAWDCLLCKSAKPLTIPNSKFQFCCLSTTVHCKLWQRLVLILLRDTIQFLFLQRIN